MPGAGIAALGTIFLPDILGVLRNSGKPEWANALTGYLQANPHFMTQLMHAGLAGAAIGGTVGGASAIATSVQSGFQAVPAASADPARNGARAEAQAHNVGHTVGSAVVVGAAAMAGIGLYKHFTGRNVFASNDTAPARTDVTQVVVPPLPAGNLQSADVRAPERPAASPGQVRADTPRVGG